MSNQKIRSIIYTVIFFVLIGTGLWWLLLRADGLNKDSAERCYADNRAVLDNIASYMTANKLDVDVTDVPTPDNRFGIRTVDSDAYRSFNDDLINFMRASCKRVRSTGKTVEFYMPAKGGLLCPRHLVLAYGEAEPTIGDASPLAMDEEGWSCYIVSGKP